MESKILSSLGKIAGVGGTGKLDSQPSSKIESGPGAVAVGGNVEGSTINVSSSPGAENKLK
jgi:hypothetical protein